jgi:hypothetical protein
MRTIAILFAASTMMLACWPVTPAHAIPRTFVSGTGAGVACTRAAPCGTFQFAHDATDPGGEINCVDAGHYGQVTITKSITIDCAGTTGVISTTDVGVTINTAGVVVRLRNLTIQGLGIDSGPGVKFTAGAALYVENCTIIDNGDNINGSGIGFFPPSGTARLFVSNSDITGNSLYGIFVEPTVSGSARVLLDGVRLERNRGVGLQAVGSFSSGATLVQARNTVVNGATTEGGIRSVSTGSSGVTSVTLDRTSSTFNTNGIIAAQPNAFVIVGRSHVVSNSTGFNASAGGAIFSYQNNHASGNVSDGAATGVLTLK